MDPVLKYPLMIVGSIAALVLPLVLFAYVWETSPLLGLLILAAIGGGIWFWIRSKTKVRYK